MTTKKELIKLIKIKGNTTEKEAKKMHDIVMEALRDGILSNDGVSIEDVVKIKVTKRKERFIKVPGVTEKVKVPERLGLKFDISDFIKESLNN